MLLSARLNRLPSRSLKVFPPKRLGESASTFTTTETKSLQVESGTLLNIKPDKLDEGLSESLGPTNAQLEVDISNVKFRRSKNKKKLESKIDEECTDDGNTDSANKLSGRSCIGDDSNEIEDINSRDLSLGEIRSDFEKWLNANRSIQADENLSHKQGCLKKNESKDASCCDSMISSCNISECSEEDKDDQKPGRPVVDWDESKSDEEQLREKCSQEKSDSYSSGCHSAAGSSSVVVSDSEGISPSFKSPEVSQQDVFLLCDEHCDSEWIDPSLLKFLSEESCINEEEEFQVVQKKKKLRMKLSDNQDTNNKCVNKPRSLPQNRNSSVLKQDKTTGLNLQVVDVVEECSEVNNKNSDFNNNIDIASDSYTNIIDASINSQPCEIDKAVVCSTNEIIPKFSEEVSDHKVTKASATVSPVEKSDFSNEVDECRWNIVKGSKKTKQNQNVNKSDLAEQTDSSRNHLKKIRSVKQSSSQEQCGTEMQYSSSDSSRRASATDELAKNSSVAEKMTDGKEHCGTVSFGSGCKDLDTFYFAGLRSPKSARNYHRIPPIKNRTLKQQRTSHMIHNPQTHDGRHFNLKQAQLFLMQAYNAIQKQKNEDSNSVVIYS